MALRTDYTNDVLDTSKNRERKYSMTENADGTVSLRDVTVYTQEGTVFGAGDINATNSAVNNLDNSVNSINLYVGEDRKLHFVNGQGADSVIPFSGLPKEIRVSYRTRGNLTGNGLPSGGQHTNWANQTVVYTRQVDNSYLLTSGGSIGSPSSGIGAGTLTDARYWSGSAEITGISFVFD